MEKKVVDDSEYDYADMDHSAAYGTSGGKPRLLDKFKYKNALIVFGIIILVLAIYKLFGVFFSAGPQKAVIPSVVDNKPPLVKPIKNSPVANEVSEKLAIMENRHQENREKLEQNANKLSKVETDIANLQVQVTLLNSTLQDVAKQLKETKAPEKKVALKKQAAKIKPVAKTQYYIQAMVPERAWLKMADGSTTTVSRGDALPGYGVVSMIDISSGTVITSMGDIIAYQANDK